MGRYDNEDYGVASGMNRQQRDLVLSINEFCFLQNKTNGSIKSQVGPLTTTISQQEALVTFNTKTKKFEECLDFEKAKQLFVSAPEGWYVILKNPTVNGEYPESGKANTSPSIKIGTKVNIPGPTSFALYPGQMAKVVRGHRLRSNQYLLARVYDADAAEKSVATIVDAEGKEVDNKTEKYFVGQLLVIKGTEVCFYMPPTGIEVIPQTPYGDDYVRDAVTLERLEYAILKDEDGEKRYVHGPAVVFPKPTETFVPSGNKKGGVIFRALELSPISGIYVKVIADYKDEDGTEHKTGEELFITGKDDNTRIYYPRVEHALIQYDGKYMHHAIAIPEGEGRYILNRLTGEISTVIGPKMYLPDPRTEVVVKRKLTAKECALLYPGNAEVRMYNDALNEKSIEKMARSGKVNDIINSAYSTSNQEDALAIFEANANISRGVSYTKPRTITLDTKYDGVVSVNVWTGYAINVVSKNGKRDVVIGPQTRLLDYDETLESMKLSTGKPKTTDSLVTTAYLRIENNKISDIINAQTSDFVDVQIKVSYCVNFLEEYKDKWFSVENYVKYLCDRERSLVKREVKKYSIKEFYAKSTDIVREVALNLTSGEETNETGGRLFKENGMLVTDVEVLAVAVQSDVAQILSKHQEEMVNRNLELLDAEKRMEITTKLAEYERQEAELKYANEAYQLEMNQKLERANFENKAEMAAKSRAEEQARAQADNDMQIIFDAIAKAKLERNKAQDEARIATEKQLAEIEKAKEMAYAETVSKIMESISPDLIASMNTQSNVALMTAITENMSPIAIAKGESVADTTNKLLRGTPIEGILQKIEDSIS